MGSMFRSEEMALTQLFLQQEAAYQAMSELGELGIVQFRDLNEDVNSFQKKFVNEVRRCNEMERKLRFIEAEVRKNKVAVPDLTETPKAPNSRQILELEAHLEKTEAETKGLSESSIQLKKDLLELTEINQILEKTQTFFMEQEETNGDSAQRALIPDDSMNVTVTGRLGFIAGVIDRDRVAGFERMLWRISRGNVFLRQADVEKPLLDPQTGDEMRKTVFAAFFQGEQLRSRIKKVCAGYHASLYPCPDTTLERQKMAQGVKVRLEDLKTVLNQTEDHLQRVLVTISQELPKWSVMVRKMKAIYHTLNMFNMDVTEKCLIAECWIPTIDIPTVQKLLSDGSNAVGSSVKSFLNVINSTQDPPTFHRSNKFTKGFQNLIDSYGIASYREVNPALYTIVTFPFLFAVMFGDCGHAVILLLFGLPMVIFEKKLMSKKFGEIWNIFFGGRYIIVMMGLFSIYTGLFYNDVFSKSINIFGTGWANNFTSYNYKEVHDADTTTLDPSYDYGGIPYPVGLDPVWQLAKNKIIFLNSYKMKLSIIFGVVHMIFGVCLNVVNFVHFRKLENIIFDFVPQILFLVCLFAWMVIMMFMKWIMYSPARLDPIYGTSCAPSVLIFFINMLLFKENEPPKGCKIYMFEGQDILQKILVVVGLLCIPFLLLGKPIYVMMQRKKAKNNMIGDVNQGMELHPEVVGSAQPRVVEEEEEEPMSEIFIYQAIHTIEYILSTISHTASYLRLWALSLAHAQLSEVLWNMVMSFGLGSTNYVGAIQLYLIFWVWSFLTVGILVNIEGLSAFLHTLRLHWVEFMSKFYTGLGYPFQPFDFNEIVEEIEGDG